MLPLRRSVIRKKILLAALQMSGDGTSLEHPSISWRVTVGLDERKDMCSTSRTRLHFLCLVQFICMNAIISCSNTENTVYGKMVLYIDHMKQYPRLVITDVSTYN